jgi:hypothetical protein
MHTQSLTGEKEHSDPQNTPVFTLSATLIRQNSVSKIAAYIGISFIETVEHYKPEGLSYFHS